jgi:pyruvate dehydrogenase E1 component
MTALAGHDMQLLCDTFRGPDDDTPTCLIAYTIKGHKLPLAWHRSNHSGMLTRE